MAPIARPRHNHLTKLHPDWLPPDPALYAPPAAPDPTSPLSDAERRPIDALDHETIARELRDDPRLAHEFRADPWLAAQIADLIGPQPRPVLPLATAPDGITPTPPGTLPTPGATSATSTTALPLRERIYTLYCQGHSQSAIARALQLDRGTVARHLAAVQADLAEEQTARFSELRQRAVDAQFAILAAAWDALAREEARETEWLANARIPYPPTDTKVVPYHAQRARLLAIAAHAARTAAHLQGLFTPMALTAALHSFGVPAATAPTAPSTALRATTTDELLTSATPPSHTGVGAHGCAPASGSPPFVGEGLGERSADPAASCGTLADAPAAAAPTLEQRGLAAGLQPASRPTTTTPDATGLPPQLNCEAPASTTTPPAPRLAAGLQPASRPTTIADPADPADPAANCGMPADGAAFPPPSPDGAHVPVETLATDRPLTTPAPVASGSPLPRTGERLSVEAALGSPLPRTREGQGVGTASGSPLPRTGEGLGVGATASPPVGPSLSVRKASS